MNNAAMKFCIQTFLWTHILFLFNPTPGEGLMGGVAGLYHWFMFNVLKKPATLFSQSGCIILHSYQQCMRVSVI